MRAQQTCEIERRKQNFLSALSVDINLLSNMLHNFFQVIQSLCAVLALVFVAISAWQIARGLRLQNISALTSSLVDLDLEFVGRPELRPYFYENKPLPSNDELLRSQCLSMAEAYSDLLEQMILSYEELEKNLLGEVFSMGRPRVSETWINSAKELVGRSPALREFLREYGDWYPETFRSVFKGVVS